eukprot:11093117-Karenia_brevis.AAC.1
MPLAPSAGSSSSTDVCLPESSVQPPPLLLHLLRRRPSLLVTVLSRQWRTSFARLCSPSLQSHGPPQ